MKRILIARGGLGIGLVAAAAVAITGCSGPASSASPGGAATTAAAAAPTADAATALAEAATQTGKLSSKVSMKSGTAITLIGVTDPTRKLGEFTMDYAEGGMSVKYETRMIGDDTYTKIAAPGSDGTIWYHMDQKGGPAGATTLSTYDSNEFTAMLQQTTEVQRVGDKGFKGLIDLTKAGESLGIAESDMAALPAKTLPFEAAMDDEGRLVQYKVDLPAIGTQPAAPMDFTFSDFGTPVDVVAPPADQVQEMPAG